MQDGETRGRLRVRVNVKACDWPPGTFSYSGACPRAETGAHTPVPTRLHRPHKEGGSELGLSPTPSCRKIELPKSSWREPHLRGSEAFFVRPLHLEHPASQTLRPGLGSKHLSWGWEDTQQGVNMTTERDLPGERTRGSLGVFYLR